MEKKSPSQATTYFESASQDLKFILDKINALKIVQEKVNAQLDPALAKQCLVANIANQTLVLLAPNSAIATRLRFESTDLLARLKKDPALAHLKQIECKVSPIKHQPENTTRAAAPLSADTAALVHDIAEDITDPALREILLKIASY